MTTYDWTVTIDGVNVSALVVGGGTIDYGRPTRGAGFQAPVAQFDMFTQATFPNYGGAWPTVTLGDPVIIHVTWDGVTQNRRFTGVVQALDWNPGGLRVTATGTSTDWQTASTGWTYVVTGMPLPLDTSIPDQTETDRVQRWVTQAGKTVTIEGVPARRVRAVPENTTPEPLLDIVLRIADDCDALLMEDRLGVVHYRTRNFDRPDPYLIPSDIIERDSLDLAYERGTHVNTVNVYYGEPDAATGQQASVFLDDSLTYNTVATVGERKAELYTDIQYEGGANGKAAVYLERNRLEWELVDVVLLMSQATGAEADDVFDLQENWMVTVDDLPTGCPIASYDGDILGMTDIMSEQDYRIVLHLGPRMADTGGVPEAPIFDEDSITGGTSSTYEDGNGFLWQLHEWTSGTGTVTVNNDVTGDLLLVAGGGGGGGYSQAAGSGTGGAGGGAGGCYAEEYPLTAGATLSVSVGTGGAGGAGGAVFTNSQPGSDGTASTFGPLTAPGGGGGAGVQWSGAANGRPGGSGGGGYGSGGLGGAGTSGYGNDGGDDVGSGPGAGGGKVGTPTGLVSTIDGSSVTYAQGGAAKSSTVGPANTGQGGGGAASGGTDAVNGAAGGSGYIAYRYRIG